jgi:hypothetical protein
MYMAIMCSCTHHLTQSLPLRTVLLTHCNSMNAAQAANKVAGKFGMGNNGGEYCKRKPSSYAKPNSLTRAMSAVNSATGSHFGRSSSDLGSPANGNRGAISRQNSGQSYVGEAHAGRW